MFRNLLKLIIKSRFSWSYFLIIFIFALYGLTTISLSSLPTGVNFSEYYFAGMLSVFSAMGILMGGLSMTRSDSDFLMVSPIRRRTMSAALYVGQYLYTGPLLLIAFAIYALASPYGMDGKLVLLGDVALLSTVPVSLSVNSTNVKIWYRIPFAALLIAWYFSFLIGLTFSPVAFSTGHLYPALVATVAISMILLVRSLYMLGSDSLAYRVLDRGSKGSFYKHIKNYSTMSPMRAVFEYGFSQFEIAARSNFSGTPTLSGRRIRTVFIYGIFAAVAVLYGYAAYITNPPHPGAGYINFVTVLVAVYIGAFPPIIMGAGSLPMERAWLSFTSMKASKYMPSITLVKMFQLAVLMSPFAVVDVALFIMGVPDALNGIPIFLVFSPLFLGLFMIINFRMQHYQIKDEKLIVSRYNAAQFVLIPPVLAFFIISAVASILPLADVFIVPVISVFIAVFMLWGNFWNKRVYKLVEKGFV